MTSNSGNSKREHPDTSPEDEEALDRAWAKLVAKGGSPAKMPPAAHDEAPDSEASVKPPLTKRS